MTTEPDKRRDRRSLFTITVSYAYSFIEEDELRCQKSEAVTTNISPRGLGLLVHRPLPEGLDMKLYSRRLGDGPVKCLVRWCRKLSEEMYRVGLEFA